MSAREEAGLAVGQRVRRKADSESFGVAPLPGSLGTVLAEPPGSVGYFIVVRWDNPPSPKYDYDYHTAEEIEPYDEPAV